MGKKIVAYQADDGKTFTGPNSKVEMERYERLKKMEKKLKTVIEYARKLFNIPASKNDDERSEQEQDIMESVDGCQAVFYFDDLVEIIVRLRLYNTSTFDEFVVYLKGM
jgi:hypothetical protein